MATFIKALGTSDLLPGSMKTVHVGGKQLPWPTSTEKFLQLTIRAVMRSVHWEVKDLSMATSSRVAVTARNLM